MPTRAESGQKGAAAPGVQTRGNAARSGAADRGSVTSARFSAACSGSKRSVVLSGGFDPRRIAPGAPSEPSADGEKPSLSHPLGVKPKVLPENVAGAS
ncbi:MAG: hypothetical protein ABW135_06500 [Thermoleophilaceae bacterium]